MGASSKDSGQMLNYYAASGIAAVVNFPLWKASAIGQSGFKIEGKSFLDRYIQAMKPPYKGVVATWAGMTWARATIFYGSDRGRQWISKQGWTFSYPSFSNDSGNSKQSREGIIQMETIQLDATHPLTGILPVLVVSTLVQIMNNPIIRATIMLQNPISTQKNVWEALQAVYEKGYRKEVNRLINNGNNNGHNNNNHGTTSAVFSSDIQGKARLQGINALWHGTSAGIMKTVPKYCTAVLVKNAFDNYYKYENPLTEEDINDKAGISKNNFSSRQSKDSLHKTTTTSPLSSSTLTMSSELNDKKINDERYRERIKQNYSPEEIEARNDAKKQLLLYRSAIKSMTAGLAGAILTNPLDVIRNEMYKTEASLVNSVKNIYKNYGLVSLLTRGMDKNIVAVTIPIGLTIFLTDTFDRWAGIIE